MKQQYYLLFISACLSLTGMAKETQPAGFKEQKQQTVSFTENKGQFADQNYNPRPDVLFGGSDGQITFYITNNGISYQLYRVDKYKEVEDPKTKELRKEIEQQTIYRTDIKWLNTNLNHFVKTDEALPGSTNYYLEQCPNGALNVKSYAGITLENIYNNINLHYYEKNGQLKYDYIVAPHADYKQIQLKVEGGKLELQEDGSLLIETPLGKIQEQAPLVYQNGKQLKARYTINNNIISFEVENYNPTYELIIDPVTRLWGTYYGETAANYGKSCATDASDNVYMAGETQISTGTLIATTGSYQSAYGGGTSDAFLVKFNSSGVRQWGTYYGVTGSDSGLSCATDASGNVYMSGVTDNSASTVIATPGSHQSAAGGGLYDAFLVKFNSSGVRQWGTYYGGTGGEVGWYCATDASGNVYMAGRTDSNNGTSIATSGSHQSAYGGGTFDSFLVKFNSSGVRQWGTYYGGAGYDEGRSCAIDASGNVYMAGRTNSNSGTVMATSGSHQSAWSGNDDAFLVKFNSSGVRQWGTYYGETGYDEGRSCTTDASGNVYMTGFTNNSTGTVIATTGSHQSVLGGSDDGFLVKFNGSGVRQWGTYYGDSGYDRGHSCTTDATGNVYVAGYSAGSSGTVIATSGSHQSTIGGTPNAFLAKFNSNGVRQWGTYYGGTGGESAWSCATGTSGNVYMVGETSTNTSTAIATTGSHQSTYGGGTTDAFLVKFNDCSVLSQPSAISGSGSVCTGATQTYSVTNDPFATFYTWSLPGGWSGTSTTNTISVTAGTSGIFTVTANDACSSSPQQTLNVTINPSPTITVNSGSICSGNSFTISPSGASTYTIQGGSAVVSPAANASYTVVGTSSAGCVSASSATSTVTVNATPSITVNSGTICSGNSFTISPGGASTYTIQGGSAVVSPAANASYTVVGTNSVGCVSASSATNNITVNITPTITVNSGSICSGNSFTISPGGASTYTIQGGSAVVSPSINTSYSVVGTSSAGCVSASSATSNITVNATPSISVNSGTICSGNSFTISPGGASTYTIQGGSAVVSPNTNASYTVVGTSPAGCVSASSATSNITVNATPTISVNSGTICSGNSFTISPGGASTYTVQGGNFVVSPGISTSYTVMGTSSAGCVSASSATSNVVNATPTITVNSGSICSGNSFTISPGGASTYTIQGGSAVVSPSINTSYTVVGTSPAGCVSANSATSNITVNATPSISVNSGTICSGNSFTISPGGASTYTIQGGNFVVSPNTNASYTVVGTSPAGCVSASSATSNITVNATPTITVNSGTICSGNSFTISPGGASTYTVQGGNFVVSPGISTSYTVMGTSSAGCVSASSATSNVVNATPTISVNSGSMCSGNSFTISPVGASTYTIQGGSAVVSPSINTSYTVVGTSPAGCVSANSATSNITVNATPTISVNSGTICSGNSFTISPGGASTYTIQGGNFVVSPNTNTSYTVVGTSPAGCVSASSATSNITVNATPTISVNSGTICSGNSFTISPGGASTYTVQGGNFVVSPGISTSYTVMGTSSAGCVSASSATSNVVNATPSISVNSGSMCSGNSFTISPVGASTYTIQGGNFVVSPNTNASYTVVGTSLAGCVSANSATSNITVNTTPTITVNSGTICSGNSFTISPGGASTYTVEGGNFVVSPGISTSYTVMGTSSAGCVSASSATSNVVNATPTITVNSGSICSGNSFTISPGGASTYTIQGGNFVVSPNTNASYTVVGTSPAGCVSASSATSNITVNATPTITVNSGSICSGDSFTISPGGASTYTVEGGNTVVSPTASTSFTVIGTSIAGCVSVSSATSMVNVNSLPTVDLSTSNTLICEGESATLTASGAFNYTFNPGGPGASIVVTPTVTSNYTVSGTDTNGCSNSTTLTQSVSICAGLSAKANFDEGFVLYPNPTNGIVTIQSPAFVQKKVEVCNSIGQTILSSELQNAHCELNLSSLPNGIYFVKIGTDIRKLIKE